MVGTLVSAVRTASIIAAKAGCVLKIQSVFQWRLPMHDGIPSKTGAWVSLRTPFYLPLRGYDPRTMHFGLPPARKPMKYIYPIKTRQKAFRADLFLPRNKISSEPENEAYFVNENAYPWAINVACWQWHYPLEYMDVIYAYAQFTVLLPIIQRWMPTAYISEEMPT